MRKLYSFLAGILLIIIVLWGVSYQIESRTQSKESDKLVIYNWGDYIDPELLTEFTKETGVQIQYDTFDSNEAMYTKVKQGGTTYDIAIPSEYMIAKMMKEGLVEKLDHSQIKGLENIGSDFLDQPFDPGNQYSIPYFWGTLGIVYNEKMVDKAPEHWNDLWRPEYKNSIMMIDGARGVTFSGEARQMLEANEDLRYVVPTEDSNLWFDNIVIPKTVKNKKAAYQFINFMLRPENAYKNALYVGYSTPNLPAKAMLPKEIQEDEAFYPTEETMKHLEVYEQLGPKWLGTYNDLYLQVKMYRK